MIRCMRQEDAAAVLDIYRDGIDGRNATFETVVPEWEAWDRRHLPHSRFVFGEDGGPILGWVALTPFSSREAYAGVGEVSVYVRSGVAGRGSGRSFSERLSHRPRSTECGRSSAAFFPRTARAFAFT